MYKVFLIDDEPWILKDLEILIDWEEYGFKIEASISDSEKAKFMIKKYRPDLIICDIKMPGMNGIELMKMVKAKYSDIFVVFLSAYSEFSYAKQAITMGAFDYILKPTDKEKMQELLIRVRRHLDKNKMELEELHRYKQSELFFELIEDRLDHQTIKNRLADIGYIQTASNYTIAIINPLERSQQPAWGKKEDWQKELENYFSEYSHLIVPVGENRCFVLINHEDFFEFNNIIPILKKNKMVVGISEFFSDLSKLKYYYKQAELMSYSYFIYKKNNCYIYNDYNNNYKEIATSLKNVDSIKSLKKMLIDLPDIIRENRVNLEEIVYLYNQIKDKYQTLFKTEFEADIMDYLDIIYSFNSLDELFSGFQGDSDLEESKQNRVSHNIIEKIIAEIKTKYDEDLRLQDMAEKYHINYNYLSQLFKKETGQSFTNYLVEFRIEEAITLFKRDLLFYEIAKMVGYSDYYHFCKIFKKHKGLSPSEYKKTMI